MRTVVDCVSSFIPLLSTEYEIVLGRKNVAVKLIITFDKGKLLKGRPICFMSILWYSIKAAFLFSLTIEFLQLFLRLGTFQLSDLCYNTLGGAMGGSVVLDGMENTKEKKISKINFLWFVLKNILYLS